MPNITRMNDQQAQDFREMAEGLLFKQFFMAMRDRQLTKEESDELLNGILNLAAIRAAERIEATSSQ